MLKRWNQQKTPSYGGVLVVRYGGFGDMLQTASVLPLLKKKFGTVTVNTTPRGMDILKEDPNIDHFIIQETNQIDNGALGDYWDKLAKGFDHFINFSESVEGTWLTMPGKMASKWPQSVKDKYLDTNYLEFMHDLADVEYSPAVKFYPTQQEKIDAKVFKKKNGPFILWVLSGSSVHKTWPYMDKLMARILVKYPKHKIVLTGDYACKILETGWEEEKRVLCKSGELKIRETLSLAQKADLVIGPETGVLNAVAFEDVPKIVFLSHSSENNLTRDWLHCYPMIPFECACYPCHQLHYSWDTCKETGIGVSECQAKITTEQVWESILKVGKKWRQVEV
jgi:ADP-heptose:LPS heptosyltransferase